MKFNKQSKMRKEFPRFMQNAYGTNWENQLDEVQKEESRRVFFSGFLSGQMSDEDVKVTINDYADFVAEIGG